MGSGAELRRKAELLWPKNRVMPADAARVLDIMCHLLGDQGEAAAYEGNTEEARLRKEVARQAKQITRLQAHNTELVLSNRQLSHDPLTARASFTRNPGSTKAEEVCYLCGKHIRHHYGPGHGSGVGAQYWCEPLTKPEGCV